MAVAKKHHNAKLDELLSVRMVDMYINFKRGAFVISLDFILAFNFNECFPSPPPLHTHTHTHTHTKFIFPLNIAFRNCRETGRALTPIPIQ